MSSFFLTNNIGGGGTNVSRFVSYLSLYNKSSCNLLLNYYYLNNDFKKKVSFDQGLLKNIKTYPSIKDFLLFAGKKNALDLNKISKEFTFNKTLWNPLILLDSGSGNILRDNSDQIKTAGDEKLYKKLISDYHNFAEILKFDICIAFDYALKYTYKNSESENQVYKEISRTFNEDLEKNYSLLSTTLKLKKEERYKHKIFAPIHGGSLEAYVDYFKKIIGLENKTGVKFDGFAIGGIANTKRMRSDVWHIPDGLSSTVKANLIIFSVVRNIRALLDAEKDERPIHVLGAGGIKNLFSLIYSGTYSFDCHTPWRRASDGDARSVNSLRTGKQIEGAKWSKFLIPLVNSQLKVITNNRFPLQYAPIFSLEDNFGCDCDVCLNFSMNKIKSMYCSNSVEDNYFAKILLFTHATWQYDFLIKKITQIKTGGGKQGVENFLNQIPSQKLRADWIQVYDLIKTSSVQ